LQRRSIIVYNLILKMPTIKTPINRAGDIYASSGLLSTISCGKRPRHIFALIYGTDGVGKLSWSTALEQEREHSVI
jgi:hypothetical protein